VAGRFGGTGISDGRSISSTYILSSAVASMKGEAHAAEFERHQGFAPACAETLHRFVEFVPGVLDQRVVNVPRRSR
jgi:hypothetical protein